MSIANTDLRIEEIVIVFYKQIAMIREPVNVIPYMSVLEVSIRVPSFGKFLEQFSIAVEIGLQRVEIIPLIRPG